MYEPDSELLYIFNHISWMFHVTIGLDPVGFFTHVENLAYEVEPFTYEEMGRNHAPHQRPFSAAGKPGRLTLKWGMIVRSKLFDWIHDVKIGKDFTRTVFVYQLSRKRLPLRVYQLTGCWPVSWTASNLSTEEPTGMSTEEVVLAYDNIEMYNLSAIAMLGELVDEPLAEALAAMKPKKIDDTKRSTAKGGQGPWEWDHKLTETWGTTETAEDREKRWQEMNERWSQRKRESLVRRAWEPVEPDPDVIATYGNREDYAGFEAEKAEDDRRAVREVLEAEFVPSQADDARRGSAVDPEKPAFEATAAEEGQAAEAGAAGEGGGDEGGGGESGEGGAT